jgi:hypothetical protein
MGAAATRRSFESTIDEWLRRCMEGTVCPGREAETKVPEPTRASKYPSASSCAYAVSTGIREMPNSDASARVDGMG